MSFFLRSIPVLGLVLMTTSCSMFFGDSGVFRSRGKDYLGSGPIKPVEVPPDMQVTSLEELYYVPAVEVQDEFGDRLELGDYEVPRPRPFTTDKSGVAVKIQSQLERRWIFLNASTSQVWPQTQSFLSSNGFDVEHSDANRGVIETGWMQFKNDPTTKSRFRIEIEKGIHPETTEVRVRQVELPMAEAPVADFSWPEVSDNPEREKFVVDNLAQALAANVDNKAASLMGQNVGGRDRIQYDSVRNEPQLKIRLPWQRAYASIAASVKSETFELWEQDGDRQLFYLDYDPDAGEKKEKGFFSKLAFWRSDDADQAKSAAKAPYKLDEVLKQLEDKPSVRRVFGDMPGVNFGEDLPNGKGYLLVVQSSMENGEEVQGIIVRDFRGRMLPPTLSKELLRQLRSNLI